MVRQDLYVIVYSESKSTEIVEASRVRLPNPNPPIGKTTFHKIELAVPDDIIEYLNTLSTRYMHIAFLYMYCLINNY